MDKVVQTAFIVCLLAFSCDALRGVTLHKATAYKGAEPRGKTVYPEFPTEAKWIGKQIIIVVRVHNPTDKTERVRIQCQWLVGDNVQFDIRKEFDVPADSSRQIDFAHLSEGGVTARCSGELLDTKTIKVMGSVQVFGKVWRTVKVPGKK